jgi:hypothetical protein
MELQDKGIFSDMNTFCYESTRTNKELVTLVQGYFYDEIIDEYIKDLNFDINQGGNYEKLRSDEYYEKLSNLVDSADYHFTYERGDDILTTYYKTLRAYEKSKNAFLDEDGLSEFTGYFWTGGREIIYDLFDMYINCKYLFKHK